MELTEYEELDPIYMKIVILVASTILIVSFLYYKLTPGDSSGRGFKSIRLTLLSSSKFKKVMAFKNLVRGMLLIGGAGSGKTKSFIEPLLLQVVKEQYTGIVYDFKFPTLANSVYENSLRVSEPKVKMYYVNFDDLTRSHRFNVFHHVHNSAYAREYASSFMMNLVPESIKNPDFFLRTATALFASSILYFSRQEKKMCTLPHIISFLLNSDIPRIVTILSSDVESADIVAPVRSGLASEKQTAGVMSTLQNSLSICSSPKIFWILSGDEFDLNLNNPEEPKLLVIGNKASLVDSISPLVSLVVTVASKQMNEAGKERSIILLDEGPTLFIPNFDNIPATGRENKIATVYCGQDIAQMEERYGEKKAEVLISNLANQFYGKISSPKTAEKIVRLFGKVDVEYKSKSLSTSSNSNYSSSKGETTSLQQRDRVTISNLRDLNPGEFVASTVELKDFRIAFPQAPSNEIQLPEITYVTDEMINDNYLKIKDDVLKLFDDAFL